LEVCNGGESWTAANVPAIPATNEILALRRDRHGACIAALVGGTASAGKVAALGSTDGGASWAITADRSLPPSVQVATSCGDGRNCLVATSDNSFLAFLHVTAGGQVSVRTQAFKSWLHIVGVSCPTGPECFVEAADESAHVYVKATLELTRDGGRTWTSLGTPMAPADPQDVADFLSCPVPAGCIAVASDPNQAQPTWEVLSNLHRGQ